MANHKSMRGEVIDLNKLAAKAEESIAVGNTKTNARGDELGRGGKVVRTADKATRDHYNNTNPKSVKVQGISADITQDKTKETTPPKPTKSAPTQSKIVKTPPADSKDQWVEDGEGNFVKKEDDK